MILRSSSKNSKRILPKVTPTSKHFYGELPEIKTYFKKEVKQNRMRFDTIRKQVLPYLKSDKSVSVKLKGFKQNQTADKIKKLYQKQHAKVVSSITTPFPQEIEREEIKQAHKKTQSSIQILQIMNQVSSNIHKQYNQTLRNSVELQFL